MNVAMQHTPKQRPPAYEARNFNADQLREYTGTGFEEGRLKLLFVAAHQPSPYRYNHDQEVLTCSIDVELLPAYTDQELGGLGLSANDIARARKIAAELPASVLTAESTL